MKRTEQAAAPARRLIPQGTVYAAVAAVLLTAFRLAHAAPLTPFTYGVVDIFDADGNVEPRSEISSSIAGVTIAAGTAPAAYATARADFGSNGFAVQALASPLGAGVGSIWSDRFRVIGGTGTGLLSLSVQIEGCAGIGCVALARRGATLRRS
jgi:hypothetical protein